MSSFNKLKIFYSHEYTNNIITRINALQNKSNNVTGQYHFQNILIKILFKSQIKILVIFDLSIFSDYVIFTWDLETYFW